MARLEWIDKHYENSGIIGLRRRHFAERLTGGWAAPRITLPKAVKSAVKDAAEKLKTAAERSWAACLRKVFECLPLICEQCGGELELIAMIASDAEVLKILTYLGQSTEWPLMNPARPPPDRAKDETRIEAAVDRWDAIQDA